jgi:hypothetical protein
MAARWIEVDEVISLFHHFAHLWAGRQVGPVDMSDWPVGRTDRQLDYSCEELRIV